MTDVVAATDEEADDGDGVGDVEEDDASGDHAAKVVSTYGSNAPRNLESRKPRMGSARSGHNCRRKGEIAGLPVERGV